MIRAEVSELKGRLNPDKHNITYIRGCYVSDHKQVISTFDSAPVLLPEEEMTKYLALFRRVLMGDLGKNLMDVAFSNQQVMDSDEHRLLMTLRETALRDEDAVSAFYQKIIESTTLEENYLILLMQDAFHVPFRGKDENKAGDMPDSQFPYILCALCPVKQTKPALSYDAGDQEFHAKTADWVVTPPELGFLFPAFDDRAANIYNALYYTKDAGNLHEDFYASLFNTDIAMPAQEQKEIFQAVLTETLQEDCDFEVVQTIHEQLSQLVEEKKKDKTAPPPAVSKQEVKAMLETCGVPEERVASFEHRYDEQIGANTALAAQNIINSKKLEMRTADVVIQVNPERGDLIETRVIDGFKYILIRADEGVQVNGMDISIRG